MGINCRHRNSSESHARDLIRSSNAIRYRVTLLPKPLLKALLALNLRGLLFLPRVRGGEEGLSAGIQTALSSLQLIFD